MYFINIIYVTLCKIMSHVLCLSAKILLVYTYLLYNMSILSMICFRCHTGDVSTDGPRGRIVRLAMYTVFYPER